MLKIYDNLTQQKREFKPIKAGHVSLYQCGQTVYDYCHIGHARGMIVFDMVTRFLRDQGYQVTFVRNITDIDDKIIRRANENDESCDTLTKRFIDIMHEDEQALGLTSVDQEPRATQYIAPIIKLIEQIIENGYAYVAENGDVCFEIRKKQDYGKLSHRDIDSLRSGARVDVADAKRDPLDFVLWKMSKPDEPSWDSPWGKGRPGWHIECSAMSTGILGQPFDIHGGGMDLKFPHHENEIAQSEAACGKGFANTWMHVGLLQINKEKMSKSLGNFLTIRETLEKHDVEVIRYFMLSAHYRSPVSYSEDVMQVAHQSLGRLYTAIRDLPEVPANENQYVQQFNDVMNDDFNSPQAFAVLFEMAREINRLRDANDMDAAAALAASLKKLSNTFGILQQDPQQFLQGGDVDAEKVEALIVARNQARKNKDWPEADRIRDELNAMHVVIEDKDGRTRWKLG
ncbi:MAG: cysteine--tRNA ligase [Gammaproteobacteria bacterium]|nr:cysteine--tRNA ligase [Gammaproteobacteria bacterium]